MSLAPGARIGSHEIVGPLGAGGMGEVYRARDTRLARDVAIKVLPDAFAADPDRRARFEREAQTVAALSHPNIVAIFDSGIDDGRAFVVMELLEGKTLRERLNSTALPARKAIEIAVQIARGLGAAHAKGLVHRDLKPENIFLLDDGQVKILDFGLARQTTAAASSGASETVAATDPGVVMGTVGYMAPEQVRAKAVDARTDVFAFGVVLYEMLSGRRAFLRETAAETMTAILKDDPPELIGSRPELSPATDRIVRHCLEKEPNERFQSMRDVAFALESLTGAGATTTTSSGQSASLPVATAEPSKREWLPIVLALLVFAAAGAGVAVGLSLRPAIPPAPKFTMKTFEPQSIFNARFLPDGQSIVFSSALKGNVPGLFEIRPGTLEARPFGPPRTHLLSVSSKGELAVLTDAHYQGHRLFTGTLARMTLEGAPRPWLDDVREADWNPDGSTLAVIRDKGGVDAIEYPIGTKLYEAPGYLSDPRVSPDGTRVAFMEHPQRFDDRGFVKIVNQAGTVTTVAGEYPAEQGIAWIDNETIRFSASASTTEADSHEPGDLANQIYRVRADGAGGPVREMTSPGNFTAHDIQKDGRWLATRDDNRYGVVARGAGQTAERDLTWLDKSWAPSLSSDGQRLLFSDGNGGPDYDLVWRKVDGSAIVRLGEGNALGWSPDGRWALTIILSKGQLWAHPSGAGSPIQIDTKGLAHVEDARWLADSKSVLLLGNEPSKPQRYYRQTLAGGAMTPVLPESIIFASVAPDGQRVLGFDATNAWVIHALDGGTPQPVPALKEDDYFVAWSPDSRSVFVRPDLEIPVRLQRVDLATNARADFRNITPPDSAGMVNVRPAGPVIKPDGSEYAYSYLRKLSTLFVVGK